MKAHKCFSQVNEAMKEHNTRLVTNIFNPNHLCIATEVIERRRDGKKASVVIATFCPFCGNRITKE